VALLVLAGTPAAGLPTVVRYGTPGFPAPPAALAPAVPGYQPRWRLRLAGPAQRFPSVRTPIPPAWSSRAPPPLSWTPTLARSCCSAPAPVRRRAD